MKNVFIIEAKLGLVIDAYTKSHKTKLHFFTNLLFFCTIIELNNNEINFN